MSTLRAFEIAYFSRITENALSAVLTVLLVLTKSDVLLIKCRHKFLIAMIDKKHTS